MKKLLIYIAFVFLLYLSFVLLLDKIEKLIYFISDDAFYYLKIAKNFTQNGIITFDNISATNGFHPLWFVLILPFFCLGEYSPETYIKAIIIFQIILCYISINLLFEKLNPRYKPQTVILVFVFFAFKFIENYINAMETCLLFLVYVLLFCYLMHCDYGLKRNKINHFLLGFIIGLIVLSRLDQIFLLISIILFLFLLNLNPLKDRIKSLFELLLGFSILFLPYAILNFGYFGHVFPISGALKSSFPFISFSLFQIYEKVNLTTIVSFVLFAIWLVVFIIKKPSSSYYNILFVFGISMVLHFLYSVLFMKWAFSDWQFNLYLFFGFLISFFAYEYIANKLPAKIAFGFFVILMLITNIRGFNEMYSRMIYKSHDSWEYQSYLASQWAKNNIIDDGKFAMSDAGIFSFFSEKDVVNLDGLVNNYEYQEVLRNKHLYNYLKQLNVKYVVHYESLDQIDMFKLKDSSIKKTCKSYLYNGASDFIELKRGNELYRSETYSDANKNSVLLIFRLE